MKFVNPIGRTPGSGVQPRACMCTEAMMMVVFIVAVAVVAKESIVQVTE